MCEIQPIMKDSGIDSAIVMNGQFIHYEGKTIYSDEFTTEECVSLHEHVKQRGHELAFTMSAVFLYRAYWHSETSL